MSWLIVTAVAAGCSGAGAGTTLDGAEIYGKVCATCHGASGKPEPARVAQIGVRDLKSPDLRVRITPELVERQVRHGSDNKFMPAFEGALSDAQIKAVAAYVASAEFLARP